MGRQDARLSPLGPSQRRVLEALLRQDAPVPPLHLSRELALSSPTILHHLRALEAAGLVERVPGGRYLAKPALFVLWVDPSRHMALEWQTSEPVPWRFPLVSRLPDASGQRLLARLLEEGDRKGTFLPWHRGRRRPAEPGDFPAGLSLVVYGSCARGDAGPKSDLDVLALRSEAYDFRDPLMGLAKESSLWGERHLDLKVVTPAEYERLPRGLRRAIETEGITVFPSLPGLRPFFLEKMLRAEG